MAFKKTTRSLDFADLALANCLEQNRSIKLMEQLSGTINWSRVESILLSHYTVGTSDEGARAYPPLMLFKCLLLQSGSVFNRTPSWKTRSTTGFPSNIPEPSIQPAGPGPLHLLALQKPPAQDRHGCHQLRDPASVRKPRT